MLPYKHKAKSRTVSNGGVDKNGAHYRQFITTDAVQLRPIVSCIWDFSVDNALEMVATPATTFQHPPKLNDLLFKYKWFSDAKTGEEKSILSVSKWTGEKWDYLPRNEQGLRWSNVKQFYPRLWSWIDERSECAVPQSVVEHWEYEATSAKWSHMMSFRDWAFKDNYELFDSLNISRNFHFTPSAKLQYKAKPLDDKFLAQHNAKNDTLLAITKTNDKVTTSIIAQGTKAVMAFDTSKVRKDIMFLTRVVEVLGMVDAHEVVTSIIVDTRFARSKIKAKKPNEAKGKRKVSNKRFRKLVINKTTAVA